jgi:uncharacterized protein (TIGR03083 family)
VTGDDVTTAVDAVAGAIVPAIEADWDKPAGLLTWSCRHTLAHVVDCLFWYASNLVRRSTSVAASPDVVDATPVDELLDSMRSGAALLALAVDSADDDARGWHSYGISDRSGFAAMGCDEVLVHGWDITSGLGLALDPPSDVAERTLRRLFPSAPTDTDPWETLLWANGRRNLGDLAPKKRWRWQCEPLAK